MTARRTIRPPLLLGVVLKIGGSAEEPFLYALNGIFSRLIDYTYTVTPAASSGGGTLGEIEARVTVGGGD